jgi:3-oxoacyl-[acyl-carrier protein] reductase
VSGRLAGRIAVISGASSGLGRASARLFAQEGAAVALLARRAERLQALAGEIEANGGDVLAIACDVAREDDVRDAVRQTVERFGRVDVLVNSAAILVQGPIVQTSLSDWQASLEINLIGTFLLIREVVPGMLERDYGRVVNVTSGWSCDGAPGYAAYGTSKAGVDSLTRSLAGEVGRADVLVNSFSPGGMKTEMWSSGPSPESVAPDVLRLATLPRGGLQGQVVRVEQRF